MRFQKLAIVLVTGLLVAGPAEAQRQGGQRPGGFGGGGFGGGGLAGMIGQSKQLQDELKMSKEQVEKLPEALAKVREDLRDVTAKLRDPDIAQEERAEIAKKISEANAKALSSVLKPEQVKRLHQIENQQAGLGVFAKEDVQKALKLSGEQKDSIEEINKELQKDMRELFQDGPGRGLTQAELTKARKDLQKSGMDNVLKALDDNQKATLKDLTGALFELRLQAFASRGTGGFAPGGPGGFGGPPQPGQIMPLFLQERLKLTPEQKKQVEELQKEVDTGLAKILTDDQKKQLKEMGQGGGRGGRRGGRGPGGRGPAGSPPGP